MEITYYTFVLLLQILICQAVKFDELYQSAVDAYESERWSDCLTFMEQALLSYEQYTTTKLDCRIKCKNSSAFKSNLLSIPVEKTVFYQFAEWNTCQTSCLQSRGYESTYDKNILSHFVSFQGYDYVQICAYKTGDLKKATAAAYTYLLLHPEHTTMQNNVAYYKSLPDVSDSDFKNLEQKSFQKFYEAGVRAYREGKYTIVVEQFELAVTNFCNEIERCHAACELDTYEIPVIRDFLYTVTGMWKQVVNCSLQCYSKLSIVDGKFDVFYFPEYYNYLQYSYFKIGMLEKAAECVETYLHLSPDNNVMKSNKAFYLQQAGISLHHFSARQEAAKYLEGKKSSEEMWQYLVSETQASFQMKLQLFLRKHSITMMAGSNRPIYDNVSTMQQTKQLKEIAAVWKTSTANNHQNIPHLSLFDCANAVINGRLPLSSLHAFLNVSHRVRELLQLHYQLSQPLVLKDAFYYCDYSTLAASVVGPSGYRKSDQVLTKCMSSEETGCSTDNQLSTIGSVLFLNSDFEDGRLELNDRSQSSKVEIQPMPGRLVSWPACSDVCWWKPVASNSRCVLTMKFSTSLSETESANWKAEGLLSHHHDLKRIANNALLQELLNTHSYKISLTESDLNGPERFAAEDVATPEQCDQLIHLANAHGIVGDGYQHKRLESPHTNFEKYAGITVNKVAEIGGIVGDGYQMAGRLTSPHTNHEMFEGLTVVRASQLALENKIEVEAARLYLTLSEKARELVHGYFNLQQPLYFDYTHLVCRTALDDTNTGRTDLSHPVHSDNCIIQADGSCRREHPAYVERDYSALLYLNGNFTGGDFFFAYPNQTAQAALHPTCGMLVGFNASNYHGVKAVLSGQRCAVAMWFTLDVRFKEVAHDTAWNLLNSINVFSHVDTQHSEL